MKVSEKDFSSQIEDLLKIYQWRWTHFRPAWSSKGYRTPIKGDRGFPDIVAVRPPRLLFIEVKSEEAKLTVEQEEWIGVLEQCQKTIILAAQKLKRGEVTIDLESSAPTVTLPEVYVWRPSDFDKVKVLLQ